MNNLPVKEQLIDEQQCLLDAIWNDQPSSVVHGFSEQGINIYRRNLFANAQRALSISFPTVFELLDSDVSASLVLPFLKSSPPAQGDWAQWGHDFAEFIGTTEIAQDYPYLVDCAALDWLVHGVSHGKDQHLQQVSLQLLADVEPERLLIRFQQNVKLLNSKYPVVEIFDAHHHPDPAQQKVAFKSAQQALSSTLLEHSIMVYRPEFQPCINKLTASEALFMQSLMANHSLAQSLDAVSHDPQFSFEKWLLNAIKHNLIHYLKET